MKPHCMTCYAQAVTALTKLYTLRGCGKKQLLQYWQKTTERNAKYFHKRTGQAVYGCPHCGKRLSYYGPDEFKPIWEAAKAKLVPNGKRCLMLQFAKVEKHYTIKESEPKVISEGLDYQWKLYYIKDVQQDRNAQGQEQAKPVVPVRQPIFDEKI